MQLWMQLVVKVAEQIIYLQLVGFSFKSASVFEAKRHKISPHCLSKQTSTYKISYVKGTLQSIIPFVRWLGCRARRPFMNMRAEIGLAFATAKDPLCEYSKAGRGPVLHSPPSSVHGDMIVAQWRCRNGDSGNWFSTPFKLLVVSRNG